MLAQEEMPHRVFARNQLLVNVLARISAKRTGRVSSNPAEKASARISKQAKPTTAADASTNSSAKNTASPSG